MVCITLLCVQTIPILSAFFLCHPYIPLSNLKNFSFTCIIIPSLISKYSSEHKRLNIHGVLGAQQWYIKLQWELEGLLREQHYTPNT